MSPAEMLHRTGRLVAAYAQRVSPPGRVPAPDGAGRGVAWLGAAADIDHAPYLHRAQRLMQGRMRVFALAEAELGAVPLWNRDPLTGVAAPLSYGPLLDYRDESLVGDIKYLWEPNRHLQLVWLCQAYYLSGEETYLHHFQAQLESWFEQCPYPLGPNWSSSLELGIRLINWSICWQLAGGDGSPLFTGDQGQAFRRRWLDSIYRHCSFIAGHWSRYSSANNHLIGEAAGLYVAALTWPCWSVAGKWAAEARGVLLREADLQNTADGVNREQAVAYQQFVLDFLVVAGIAANRSGAPFPADYWRRIEAMLVFLASVMDCAGNVPMIGDADDGFVMALSAEQDFCPYRSLLATGAAMLNRPDFQARAQQVDDKTRWLLGPVAPDASAAAGKRCLRRGFPEGGYYILGSDFDSEAEIRCVVDCGSLGYLQIAAHGHADALSFVLSVSGREFLVDPGTCVYHTQRVWRDYFRGTAAHNTVRVDGRDQSEPGGNFMWTRHARSRCLLWQPGDNRQRLRGCHDGYRRLADPVVHSREFGFDSGTGRLTITDALECTGRHSVERFWHFSEDCRVTLSGHRLEVENGGRVITVELDATAVDRIELYRGSERPVLGWVSRSFDTRVPATTVVERVNITGAVRLNASIACGENLLRETEKSTMGEQ